MGWKWKVDSLLWHMPYLILLTLEVSNVYQWRVWPWNDLSQILNNESIPFILSSTVVYSWFQLKSIFIDISPSLNTCCIVDCTSGCLQCYVEFIVYIQSSIVGYRGMELRSFNAMLYIIIHNKDTYYQTHEGNLSYINMYVTCGYHIDDLGHHVSVH